jgi:3-Oxoacyl-[acyl-carrier-protein (ACP)] synthase III C terminal
VKLIEATAERMGVPLERVMITIQKYGNTIAATTRCACGSREAARARRQPDAKFRKPLSGSTKDRYY